MWNQLKEMVTVVKDAFKGEDAVKAEQAIKCEEVVNDLQKKLKKRHVNRLSASKCNFKSGLIFINLVDNFEKIGDHLTNIAQGVAEEMKIQKG